MRRFSAVGRIAAVLALVVAVVVLVALLGGGGAPDYEVTAEFENAAQIVGGEQVVVGGVAAGKVSEVELGSNGNALITFSVNEDYAPLPEETVATIRSYSLSGIANRQIQLTLPPAGQETEAIPSGGTMTLASTVSEVDLDEIFNTLDPDTIEDFKHVIQGFEQSYAGVEEQANKGFHYLNPFLSTSRKLFAELTFDEGALRQLLVDGAKLSGALAESRDDVSLVVHNLNGMMSAIGSQKEALAEAVAKLPEFMRDANTTFVNLRSTLDDVDPLVDASKPVAEKLRPFFADLRAVSADAVPTIRDLDAIVSQPGSDNDLVELTRLQRPLAKAALGSGEPDCGSDPSSDFDEAADDDFDQGAFGESICSLRNGLPPLAHFRPYTSELVGWFDDFSGHSGGYDATGGYGRISTTFNQFTLSPASGLPILPIAPGFPGPTDQFEILDVGNVNKCPGASSHDNVDDSVPFTDGGNLNCDPEQLIPGP